MRAVEDTTRGRLARGRQRWLGLAAFVAAGAVVGGAVSAAAVTRVFWPQEEVSAPLPGAPMITALNDGIEVEGKGSQAIDLPPVPASATDLSVAFACLSVGEFAWGVTPSNNPGMICDRPGATTSFDFVVTPETTTLYVTADSAAAWSLITTYVHKEATAFGTNQNGETFGVVGEGGSMPDLIAVIGVNDVGDLVDGFVRKTDLVNPTPTSPEQALEWQAEEQAKYPDGRPIPVYESDGATRIGTFTVQVG